MSDRYARVYYDRIARDPKFDGIRNDYRVMGAWQLLLVEAEKAWPAPAFRPPAAWVPARHFRELVKRQIIDEEPDGRYRMHGLDTERGKRSSKAKDAADARWSATGNADSNALSSADSNADASASRARVFSSPLSSSLSPGEGGVGGEPRARAISEADDPYQAYVDATRSLTYPDPQSNLGRWIDRLAERFGGPATAAAIRKAGATSTDPKGPMKEAESILLRDAVAAERAERADEQRRVAEKRKPVVLRRADDDISDEEADRLAREYRGGAA